MRTRILALLPLALSSACVVIELHEGNGVPAVELRDPGDFDGVLSTSMVDVDISYGEVAAVELSCDQNLLPYILTEVQDGVLVIRTETPARWAGGLIPRTDCRASVVSPSLRSVENTGSGALSVQEDASLELETVRASGSGDVEILGPIVVDRLSADALGSGGLRFAAVDGAELALSSSGSGDVEVDEGSAELLSLVSSGSGGIFARGVPAETVRAVLSGSGDGEVTVGLSLEATLSGSGDLHVWGSPDQWDVVSAGSGEVVYGN